MPPTVPNYSGNMTDANEKSWAPHPGSQYLGNGVYRIGAVRRDAVTGRYITNGDSWNTWKNPPSKEEEHMTQEKIEEGTIVKRGAITLDWEVILDHYEEAQNGVPLYPLYDVQMSNGQEPDEFFDNIDDAVRWAESR